ncbi:hypothetical protein JRQ81_013054 [Phrynocephalus forsythii]|uniref:Phospholipid-transporting ATPase n=1 Tax=Phrynocephalus forsythii TaxID=171643 RepID=A0A9Q0Y1N4_9SAUR|nr:hypothetical protein JRQ81_013054 [Phrynocephalus forsythii]
MTHWSPAGCVRERAKKERHLRANDRAFNLQFDYAKNSIRTSKYNVFTFLPLNLFEQFQRVANAYFLFLLLLQLIPAISSLSWFTTVVPLVLVLAVSAAKDAIDDVNRHKTDRQVNNRPVKVLVNGSLKEDRWLNVKVGDIVKLENNNFVTVRLCCFVSCHAVSPPICRFRETNLKVKQALTVTSELGEDLQALSSFDGEITCEAPNNKLNQFRGNLAFRGQVYPLDNENMLLRGCTVRNTDWCFGLVIFAGPDTKLMQNSGRTTFKRTSIERLMNYLVLVIFGFLAAMCLTLALGNSAWEYRKGYYFQGYLPWDKNVHSSFYSAFLMFWSYVIILNTLVPISLYVSVEIIRLGNSFYIDWDRKMYCALSDTPAQARTTTLNEELGQIKYIFSDKTGTLTQNIMAFNKCSIDGQAYGDVFDTEGHRVEVTERTPKVDFSFNPLADPKFVFYDQNLVGAVKAGDAPTHRFFRLLSLCHTVMPEEKREGALVYQAQSPDEGALVTAARNFGFVFRARTPETITVVEMGETLVYELLAILDFNYVRKRMSVIAECLPPDSSYCKGASFLPSFSDTILYELLHPSCAALKEKTTKHLDEFAGEGLRTLVVAYRDLSQAYFEEWQQRHHEASVALQDREEKLSGLYEEIERDLLLLGATAIEDKLQDGVPQTIEILGRAHIKIWVLTGDKQETAVNIGYACHMLYDDMNDIFIVQGNTPEAVWQELRQARRKMLPDAGREGEVDPEAAEPNGPTTVLPDEQPSGEYGLVISGHSLAFALEGRLEGELVRAACLCKAVICCRMTPLQKAQVVELVKKYKGAVTLAIGDGANDVNMIKTAHIGVGISGQEGMQAVLSSDFSFAQFRYLQRLLLVHGRWSYLRMCKFLAYFFYKNFAFTLVHFWYGFFSGFSAQTVYDEWFITLYNMVYTSMPVLGMSLFDQVSDRPPILPPPPPALPGRERPLEPAVSPALHPGQQNLYFNKRKIFKCTLYSLYSSLVLFFVPYGTLSNSVQSDGKVIADYQSFALIAQTCLLIVVSVQIGLDTAYWTAVNQMFIWGSLGVYFAITFTMYSDGTGPRPRWPRLKQGKRSVQLTLPVVSFAPLSPHHFQGTARNTLNQPTVWLSVLLCVILCVMPVVGFRFLKAQLKPTLSDKVLRRVRELQKRPPPPSPKRRQRRSVSRRSGYAFSHQQGFGALITSGRNMRPKSPFSHTGFYSPNSGGGGGGEQQRLKWADRR